MRVKCISELPNNEQAKQLGIGKHYYPGKMEFGISIGQEFVVFGMCFLDGIPWIEIANDSMTYVYSVPLCLFKVIDSHVSKYWSLHTNENGDIYLWPLSFYKPFYHDDLTDGVPDIVKDFQRVRDMILEEDFTNQLITDKDLLS